MFNFLGSSVSSDVLSTNVSGLLSLDPGLEVSFDEDALFSSTQLIDVVQSTEAVSDNRESESSSSDSHGNEEYESDIYDDIENVDPDIVDRGYVNDHDSNPAHANFFDSGLNPAHANLSDSGSNAALANRSDPGSIPALDNRSDRGSNPALANRLDPGLNPALENRSNPGSNPALANRSIVAGAHEVNFNLQNRRSAHVGNSDRDQPNASDGQVADIFLQDAAADQGFDVVHGQGAEIVHGQGTKIVLPNDTVGQGEEHQEEEPAVNQNQEENDSEGNWLTYSELMLDSYPAKSKLIYLKAYKMFERYLKSQKQFVENVAPTEIQILNNFHFLKHEKHLAPTTLWSTYSRVNACVKRLFGFSLKNFVRVSDVLKSYESGYKVKKASIFSPQEVFIN